ncbi:MAG: hypothetical protein KDG55_10595 [Rhodocyclaceae bacterium]|nr:hypothetical protein [Rhodocyclaceae bacterium]
MIRTALAVALLVAPPASAAARCTAEQARQAYAELVQQANARIVQAHAPVALVKEQRGHVRVARSSADSLGPLADPDRQGELASELQKLGERLQKKPAGVCGEALKLREAYRLDD